MIFIKHRFKKVRSKAPPFNIKSGSIGIIQLEDLINSIRGITEIEQAESDRNFQELVAIIGVGLAAGANFTSVSADFPYAKDTIRASDHPVGNFLSKYSVPEPWLAPGISLILSLIVSIVGGIVGLVGVKLFWYIGKKWEQRSRR